MTNVVVVGAQWGDEGKGKIVDYYTQKADIVCRFQGGNNAGHTLVVNGQKTVLHHIPSGVFHRRVQGVVGNGVVIDPEVCVQEINHLKQMGYLKTQRTLSISSLAHVIMPYHKLIDELREERKGADKIGTTKRGIGPCYEDKVGRRGIRMGDLIDPQLFYKRLNEVLPEKNEYIVKVLGGAALDLDEMYQKYKNNAAVLKPYVTNVVLMLQGALQRKKKILFEGAQGAALDVDHGTYPFVTSSNTVSGQACVGVGIGPTHIDEVIGVTKAYTTRVGGGPFPTELQDKVGEHLREEGHEYGATTGRPRRCGWLDILQLRQAIAINGLTSLAMTKLDVFSGLENVKVCTSYRYRGRVLKEFPENIEILSQCEPVYQTMKGWRVDISDVRKKAQLPSSAQNFIKKVEMLLKVPIALVSVGPARDQNIIFKNIF
ncbi:MAG: adenylosuccinate synthase [Deltaproteobacteria bacterium RIFCSPLOWO2_02_FULL_50_16]|nr:MAG: adenylosuccinate synthase [Deltaproteobacteria bacterium RIFCSPHIGHO2_02_FULL_50_15]OGQ57003.1 MAG: adenylosuccinate synthase [Deltaproteobacteria bacterium RIFCSPLOWO2_02_FULL_50_16]OGQ66092.1 MAG: adenylosuccinate synthase [Deltaproteobacteria bacterium RIFCSPLOWO2_12_FULL_50_11]